MSDQITSEEAHMKLIGLIKDARICMLTTMTPDGQHVSRPMGMQETDFDGDLWFFTYKDSSKAQQIQANEQVNVAFNDQKNSSWVSIAGRASIVEDRQKAEELWNPILKAWFPDGLETPGLVLIKVESDTAEYWDSPSSKVITLFSMVKGAITGKPANPGDNETVGL